MATTASQVQVPAAGTYTLDPARSSVAFSTKHMFGAGTVRGTFAVKSGQVEITDPPVGSSVRAEVHADSFASGNRQRDKDVRSKKLLHAKEFPVLSLDAADISKEIDGPWRLRGTLTVRGVSAPLELTITSAAASEGTLTVTAVGDVDRYAHGITAFKGMAARRLQIEIKATATHVSQFSPESRDAARA